jgi:tetratricopeptide (TPR) repeat protein
VTPKTAKALIVAIVLGCGAAVPLAPPDAHGQSNARIVEPWARDVRAWVGSVWEHEPGRPDRAFAFAAGLEPLRLETILQDVVELRNRMADRPSRIAYRGMTLTADDLQQMLQLSADEERQGNVNRLLERGALLHADVGMLGSPGDEPPPPGGRRPVFNTEDGRHTGNDTESYHWTFAYALLDALRPGPAASVYARAWYVAIGAYMQRLRFISASDRHFARARRLFPADAELLFRGACALETLSSPSVRVAIDSIALPPRERFDVPSAGACAHQAEEIFRRALAADPGMSEARVRLARLLGDRGQHEQARDELLRVSVDDAGAVGRYFVALFLGREQEALLREDQARAAYEKAVSACPSAQSPLLALARLEHRLGNRPAALDAMARLWRLPTAVRDRDDPWFQYYLMQGADADARIAVLYRSAPSRPPAVSEGRMP